MSSGELSKPNERDAAIHRLVWFELQVAPFSYRFAIVPEQPILIGFGGHNGQKGVTALIQRELVPDVFQNTVDRVARLVNKNGVLGLTQRSPKDAFADASLGGPSVHLRVAYSDDTRWASLYQIDDTPSEITNLIEDTKALAKQVMEQQSMQTIDGETARACVNPSNRAAQQRSPSLTVKVHRSGTISANGKSVDMADLESMLDDLVLKNGTVCYTREHPDEQPSELTGKVIDQVMGAITSRRLPIRLHADEPSTGLERAGNLEGRVRVVFFGEILPGHRPEQVKTDMSALLKVTRDEIDSVFSGKRIVLRKDLPADQAPRYKAYLEKLGVRVVIEPMEAVVAASAFPRLRGVNDADAAPAATENDTPSSSQSVAAPRPSMDAPIQPIETPAEIECPRCHERQPKRVLCRSCAVDMPRFLAARQQAEEEERASRSAARQMLVDRRLSGSRASADEQYASIGTSILGIGFSGRVGQMSYLAGTLVYASVMMWIFIAALKTQGIGLALAAFPVVVFLNLRLMILRLHDIGVTGWWWLVSFVPIVNFVLTVALYAVPGSRDDKGYGLPSRGSSLIGVLVAGFFCAISTVGFIDALRPALPALAAEYLANAAGTIAHDGEPRGTGEGSSAGYYSSANTVIMYSLSTCPYCAQKRRELDAAGIRYTEFFIDQNEQAAARLNEKLERAGLPPQSYGVPILDVNGKMLPNNPSMNEIVRHLRGRTT